jgi:hypothetical protein
MMPWMGFCAFAQQSPPLPVSPLPVGFEPADADSNGSVSRTEWDQYLTDRLKMANLPLDEIFFGIDQDGDGSLSRTEFDNRHQVLQGFVPADVLGTSIPDIPDPGADFVPFQGLDKPLDDLGIYGAIFHRYLEQLGQVRQWKEAGWKRVNRRRIPESIGIPLGVAETRTLEQICHATVVIGGGGSADAFFTGGAVIISPDGIALTNYHIATGFNEKLIGLMSDGRVIRVTKFLAGNPKTDVALVQFEGSDFPWVPIAPSAPAMAQDIFLMHHTENRFYTYDRGYVKRYPKIGEHAWLEISADYAPGGSGCGIFNQQHQLVGLVSTIMTGDGPSIATTDMSISDDDDLLSGAFAETTMDELPDNPFPDDQFQDEGFEMGTLVVKLAVPLSAMQAICSQAATAK